MKKQTCRESAGGSLPCQPRFVLPAHLAPGFNPKYRADFFNPARVPSGPREGADQFALAAAHQGGGSTAEEGVDASNIVAFFQNW